MRFNLLRSDRSVSKPHLPLNLGSQISAAVVPTANYRPGAHLVPNLAHHFAARYRRDERLGLLRLDAEPGPDLLNCEHRGGARWVDEAGRGEGRDGRGHFSENWSRRELELGGAKRGSGLDWGELGRAAVLYEGSSCGRTRSGERDAVGVAKDCRLFDPHHARPGRVTTPGD